MSELSIVLVTETSALEALREPWAALLAKSATNEVTQGPTWLLSWWRVFGAVQNRELSVLAMYNDGELVGLAPMCKRKTSPLGLVRLEFLGSGEEEEHEICSEYLGLLAAVGFEQVVADAFGNALRDGTLDPWDETSLTAMSSEAVISSLTARALGRGVGYQVIGGAPFALLPDLWDEYLAALPSSRRYLIRRSLKAWEKWAKAPPVLRRVEHAHQLDDAFDMLASLHGERWKEVGHQGAFSSPLFSDFHRETMHALFRKGALWLCWLEVEGEPIVAIYNIVWNNQVRFYQSGRKVDLPKKVRAGLVIHACAIRESIEAGYSHYDFLAGTTRYKMQLANNVRPLMQLSLSRPTLRSRLSRAGIAGGQWARGVRHVVKGYVAKRRGNES